MEITKLNWLKEKRKEKRLTTYSIAEKIGISQSMYSSIENGSRGVSVDNAKKIAKVLGFKWTDFYK